MLPLPLYAPGTETLKFKGILFDFNGTLSNDEEMMEELYDSTLLSFGLPMLKPGEYNSLLGKSDPDIATHLLAHRSSEIQPKNFLNAFSKEYVEQCREHPRVSDLTVKFLLELRNSDIQVGIITGTLPQMIFPVLQDRSLEFLIPFTRTIEDVTQGKPHPEGYVLGAEMLGVSPEDIVVCEDSNSGRAAAESAGMAVIGIGPNISPDSVMAHYGSIDSFIMDRQ